MKLACRKAFAQEILQLAKENSDILVVTSDARGSFTMNAFAEELPEQLVEIGIAEQNAVGVAGGLAAWGKIPFVCSPAPFLSSRSYEQIKIDAAYNNRNMKLVGVSGGISYGALGLSHHSTQDIAAVRAIAGIHVLVPSDANQTRALTKLMADTVGPFYMRMGRRDVPYIYEESETFELGKAKQIHDGEDLTIIAMGELVYYALEAAKLLEKENIYVRVLDMFSIKPLDQEAIRRAAEETGRILILEEHSVVGGLGSAVAEVVTETCPVPVKKVGLPDDHIYSAEAPDLYAYYGWTAEGIAETVRKWIG